MHQSQQVRAVAEGIAAKALEQQNLETICALLFTLSSTKAFTQIQSRLAEYLIDVTTTAWLKQATLREACITVNALQAYSKNLPRGDQLAIVLQKLMAAEQKPGGPYGQPRVEPSTNVAIASFGSWAAGGLPEVEHYIRACLADKTYLPSEIDALYLAALDLPNAPVKEAGLRLLSSDQSLLCTSSPGSLIRCLYALGKADLAARSGQNSPTRSHIHEVMLLELSQNPAPIKEQGMRLYQRLVTADVDLEISLFPYYFQQSMRQPTGSRQQILQLGIANVYAWLAYMTYDGILDGDSNRQSLPFANVAHRQSLWHYQSAAKEYFGTVRQMFCTVDQANAWEVQEARCEVRDGNIILRSIPAYATCDQLANRSIAHACGPLYLASISPLGQQQYQLLVAAFRHYIIAKQLNDDIHDWQEDLRAGCITYVVAGLLRALRIGPGTYSVEILIDQMRCMLWDDQGQRIVQHIQHHVGRARQFFIASEYITDSNIILDMLANLESIAHQAQVVRRRGATFIQQLKGDQALHLGA